MANRTMRVCSGCETENLAWATRCKECGESLEDAPLTIAPVRIRVPGPVLMGLALCFLAFGLLWGIAQNGGGSPSGKKDLQVLWHKFYGSYGKEWIVGEVRNQSGQKLKGVRATGEYFTADRREVAVATALLKPSDLSPGQTGKFEIAAPYREEIERSWFHFRTGSGRMISFQRDAAGR